MFNLFKKKKKKKENKIAAVKTVTAVSSTRAPYTGGKVWTTEEDMIITGFYNLGIPYAYIAEKLTECGHERSINAVQIRIHRLNKINGGKV
jgi:hypothetical protein